MTYKQVMRVKPYQRAQPPKTRALPHDLKTGHVRESYQNII